MKQNSLISIILPTFNEEENIASLILEIKRYLKNYRYEIIVVDDNSTDGTQRVIKINFLKDERIKLLIRKKNRGLAYSILNGIKSSQGNYILVMDTDFNHHPKDIPLLLKQRKKYDLIVGSRYIKGGGMENRLRYYLSYVYNIVIRAVLHLPTKDNLSGFFVIKRNKLDQLNFEKIFYGYGDYFIRLLFFTSKKRLRILEIPVFYKNRAFGQSKSRFFSMFLQYTNTVLDLLRNS